MNRFELAAVIVIAAGIPCLGVCLLAGAADALVAVEVASVLAATALMLLAAGFHRQPFVDLALVMAVVATIGSLTLARLIERDL